MSTNKIKPSDLAVWSGDKSMSIHAHKPGVSQQVTVQEIIDAVPVPVIDSSEIEAAKVAAIDAKDQAVIAKDAAAVSRQSAFSYYEAAKAWSESASSAYTSAQLWSERSQAWAEAQKGAVINNEGSSAKHWALTAQDIADAAEVSKQGALSAYNAATAWSERAQAWAEAPRDAVINNEGSSAKHWAMVAQDIADGMSGGGSGGGGFPGENVDDTISNDVRKAWAAVSAIGQADGSIYDLDDPRGKHVLHPGMSIFIGGTMPIAASPSPIIVAWDGAWRYQRHDGDTGSMRVESFGGTQRPSFWAKMGTGSQPSTVHIVGGLYSKVRIHSGMSDFTPYVDVSGYTRDGYAILETIPHVDADLWTYDVFVKGDKTKSPAANNYKCVQNLTITYIKVGDPNADILTRTFTRELSRSAGSFRSNWKMVSGAGSES